MDTQSLFNIAIGVIMTGIGWFGRQLWDAVERLKEDLHKIEVELPSSYVKKDEFTEFAREIRDISKEIFNRISNIEQRKADR